MPRTGPSRTAAGAAPRLGTLVLLTAASVLSLNMFLPSLPGIAADLGVDYTLISLSIPGYLAVTALLQVVLGPLSDRYGRRPVLLGCVAVFTLASAVCALAQNAAVFLAFRVLQGAIIAGAALSPAVIRDTAAPGAAATRISHVAMSMAVAPMVGPMIGGVLDGAFGWRANFAAYTAMGAALLWLVWTDLGETNTARAATMTAQLRAYPELLRARRFWACSLCMAFGVGAFYIFIAGAPLVAAELFGMSPALLGFAIGTITIGFFAGSFVSGRIAARMGIARMVLAGRLVALAGLAAGLLLYAAGPFNAAIFFGATICVGIGNGLSTPSAQAGALSARPGLAGSASGLSGALVVATGAVLTTLPATLLTPQNGAWMLLALMLGSAVAALLAGLYLWRLDRHPRRPG